MTCGSRSRCTACCRATSVPARRSWPCLPRSWRWRTAFKRPSWRRPRFWPGQHYENVARLLSQSRFRVGLLTGSTPGLKKHTLHADIERGTTNLIVGTHALVQETIGFHRLGFVVIDEQHRFGVAQRAALRAKGLRPDVLLMTATPIPRTLALTDYSELDVSKITDLPPGRTPVQTLVQPESRRDEIYQLVRDELDRGRQAYVIYPLVEGSEKIDLKSATEMADHLQAEVFPSYRVALLHGRMKPDAKNRVMHAFAAGEIHILVSTTVVEVGVDVPNASVMVVEHARTVRALTTAPASRARRPRTVAVALCAAVSVIMDRRRAGASESAGIDERRVRDRGA